MFIENRVWIGKYKNQVYYSPSDKTRYTYWAFESRDGKTYTPRVDAKGTPATNPMPTVTADNFFKYKDYREGWYGLDYYKIKDDSLILQNIDDTDALYLTKHKITIGNDTTIGVFNYSTIILGAGAGKEVFKSKKR